MASNPVAVERLWNSYALEEDEERKKLWLDIFLCRSTDGDKFLATTLARKKVIPHLILELKNEIGLFCSPNLAAEDLEQLKR